jgi:hypothetical protein
LIITLFFYNIYSNIIFIPFFQFFVFSYPYLNFRFFSYIGSDFGNRGPHQTGKGAKYAVAVSIGCHEIRSTFKTYENGICEWTELAEKINLILPEMRMMPDMFITVYRGSEESSQSVAFTRVKTLTIMKGGLDECVPTWYELTHDQSHRNNSTLGYPGSVLLKTALVNTQVTHTHTVHTHNIYTHNIYIHI